MGKIKFQNLNSGLTLIELIMYMSIFCMIFLSILSTVFYLQKIMQNNNQDFYVKNQIYANLDILQQYAAYSNLDTVGGGLQIADGHGRLILTQKLENNRIMNVYSDKAFSIDPYIHFTSYVLTTLYNGRLLKVDFSWLDSRGKVQTLTDYVIVISHIL